MISDIRIQTSFLGHRKRKKLKKILGHDGTGYLIDLWIQTALNHPGGTLKGLDAADIALDAGWDGDPEEFVKALLTVGFLEHKGDGFEVHDWKDHQPYVVDAPNRAEQARRAAQARWNKTPNCSEHTDSIQASCDEHAVRNAPSFQPSDLPSNQSKTIVASQGDRLVDIHQVTELCEQLKRRILDQNPDAEVPDEWDRNNGWLRQADYLLRFDHQDPQEVKDLITWVFEGTNEHWPEKIRDMAKFRACYQQIKASRDEETGA